jgi:hypothetical protein
MTPELEEPPTVEPIRELHHCCICQDIIALKAQKYWLPDEGEGYRHAHPSCMGGFPEIK